MSRRADRVGGRILTIRDPLLEGQYVEAGATWVPYMLFRLDNHYEARPKEMIGLTMPPSEYFKRQCVICSFEPEEALLAETMNWFKGENMACTSDYPHWDGDTPDFAGRSLPESLRQRVLSETARELYNFPPSPEREPAAEAAIASGGHD